MDIPDLRWWGWGTLDRTFPLEGRPRFWPMLKGWLGLPDDLRHRPPVPLEEIDLRPSRLDDPMLVSLRRLLGEEAVRTDKRARVEHSCGKAYRDLVRVRAGVVPNPPDAVVYPADEGQVAAVLSWAAERDIAVIPFGGGSNLVGAVEPGEQLTITLDMAHLNRVVSLDPTSRTARIQAGATGPQVEAQLTAQGFTLGHFPQSFEFSTLGGWLATRSAGQAATGYGKIEDMTQAVRLVTPAGIIETRNTPASASGPSLLQALLGSEGAYGVITEATLRLHPKPAVQDYRGFLFRSFQNGLDTLRDLMQHAPTPTVARLSDPGETAGLIAMTRKRHPVQALTDQALASYLTRKGFVLPETQGAVIPDDNIASFLTLGYDGAAGPVRQHWRQAASICRDHGGLPLGRAAGENWAQSRFLFPFIRDALLGAGVMVGMLESATTWSNLKHLYQEMTAATATAIRATTAGGPAWVMTHVTHTSAWGASLCTAFLCRQVAGREIEQWAEVKQAATEAILSAGGTLSHHHGIGREHLPWLEREVGPLGTASLRALKRTLDPGNIMNPGVLLR